MIEVLLVFVPVLGGAIAHGLVLRFDWFPWLKRPLDAGMKLRSRRIFGENKTWRGALVIPVGTILGALGLSTWPLFWSELPPEIQQAPPAWYGLLLGLGCVVGELPNSFIKRQLDVPPGGRTRSALRSIFTIYDQGDIVLGVWVLLLPIWVMSLLQALVAFGAVTVAHSIANVVAYRLRMRDTLT